MLALLAVVLLVAPGFLLAPRLVEAQAASDPWWGGSDRANPTLGFAIRIPVIVENTRTYPMRDAVVGADVDFGKLLVEAGWTNRTAGTEATVRGFTLDEDSIRVIEYGPGFAPGPIEGPNTKPTPSTFYRSSLYGGFRRDFDAERNPAGSVAFLVKGDLQPAQRRYYYIYANPLEYGDTPAYEGPLVERAPLDAFAWGSHGLYTYGYQPQVSGQTHKVQIASLYPNEKVRVEIYTYNLGRFSLLPSTPTQKNPFDMVPGDMFASVYVPAGTAFKVATDKPVAVFQHGNVTGDYSLFKRTGGGDGAMETWGYVPALNGSYAGNDFLVYYARAGAPNAIFVQRAAGSGAVEVQLENPLTGAPLGGDAGRATLSAAKPTATLQPLGVPALNWVRVTVTGGNVLVSTAPIDRVHRTPPPGLGPFPFHTIPVPALSGGPVGDDFLFLMPNDGGFARVCAEEPIEGRLIEAQRPSYTLVPEGPLEGTQPLRVAPTTASCLMVNATGGMPENKLELYTLKGDAARPGLLRVTQGAGERSDERTNRPAIVGAFAGHRGIDYHTFGPIGVFGYYNDTRVTLQVEKFQNNQKVMVNQTTFAISEDGFQTFDPAKQFPGATGHARLVATKPIGVTGIAPADHQFLRFVPGRPEQPNVVVGDLDFRGPLVELRSREKDARQDFRSTGPGSPVTFPLEVANLGRWIGGESLPDTITVTCSGPEGWTVAGCAKQINLGSGQAERLDIAVTPPVDALNVNGTFLVEARSGRGDVISQFKLLVFVEIRYGVGMWFDVEGGRKTIDPAIGVDPAETYRYSIVLKNTGSARDRFDLEVEDARPGWTQELLVDGEPATAVALDGGESTIVTFAVTAPNQETAQQNIVRISAQSQSSTLAADVVNTATRIRPKININLVVDPTTRVAEPNETATFNLTVGNSGNDIFRIVFTREGLLPEGWNATLGIDEIDLAPGEPYTFPLTVVPPPGARAGDLATVKITAETDVGSGGARVPGDQVSAVVVVRRVHNITAPSVLDAIAEPGETFAYTVALENHGNGNDIVELLPAAVTPAWRVLAGVQSLAIEADATEDFPLAITVPSGTPPGLYNLTMTLRLTREATQNISIPVQVEASARVLIEGAERVDLSPGRARTLAVTARNVGNVPGTFAFEGAAPAGWNVTFTPERLLLAPGDALPVLMSLNASRDAADGEYTFDLRSTLGGAPAGATPLVASLARPQLALERVEAQGTVVAGDLLLVTAVVRNDGGMAADNVSIALVVDGAPVDRVLISRVPIGESKVATLNWLATKRTDDIRVVLDPDHEIAVEARDTYESDVTFGTTLPVPGAGLLALLVAVALALGFSRRWRA